MGCNESINKKMDISFKKLFKSQAIIFPILLFIITVPTFSPLVRPGYFTMQDDLQAFRIQQMDKCFDDGQVPCRWVPDAGYQYGYPLFNYYSPGIFYFGVGLHRLGISIIDSVKVIFILGFISAPLLMYLFLNTFLNKWAALGSSVLYGYAPFRAQEVYVRGAISEFWALTFFPLLFWSSYNLIRSGKLKYFLYFSLSLALLLLTHNLMSFIFVPILALWILAVLAIEDRWNNAIKTILSGVLGVGLAAFFLLPVVFEKQYAHTETLLGGYFDYRQHFVNIYELFISNHFGYGSSVLGPNDDLTLSVGQISWIFSLFTALLAILFFKKNRKLSLIVFFLALVELSLLFLMHQRSSFVWNLFSPLAYLQFPWRLLGPSSFLLSTLTAIGIFLSSQIKNREISNVLPWRINLTHIFSISVIILVLALYANFFRPKDWYQISDQEKFSGKSWDIQLTTSIFDYLPIYAKLPPNHKAPDLPEILDGQAKFVNYKKGSNFQVGLVDVQKDATIRLPLFDFPGMQVTVDNSKTAHGHDDCRSEEICLGLISFKASPGKHKIKAQLQDTLVRSIGNAVSGASLLVFLIILATQSPKIKNPFVNGDS